MIRITCTSCQKPLSIDETKLPMKEVAFPCPACKTKLTLDRRKFAAEGATAEAAVTAPALTASSMGADSIPDDEDDSGMARRALIVGVDSPALRDAANKLNAHPVFFPAIEAAREYYLREYPEIVFLNPAQLSQPPLTDLAPMVSVAPADRRKGFFILVADGLRTLDGNAAFLYSVNMVIATKDLPNIARIYRDAEHAHKKLYQAMAALRG